MRQSVEGAGVPSLKLSKLTLTFLNPVPAELSYEQEYPLIWEALPALETKPHMLQEYGWFQKLVSHPWSVTVLLFRDNSAVTHHKQVTDDQ